MSRLGGAGLLLLLTSSAPSTSGQAGWSNSMSGLGGEGEGRARGGRGWEEWKGRYKQNEQILKAWPPKEGCKGGRGTGTGGQGGE